MQIVIDIPERIHYAIKLGITVNGSNASQMLIDAVKNGTPLPKGHGNLIDANLFVQEHPLAFVRDVIKDAPVIIKADKGEKI